MNSLEEKVDRLTEAVEKFLGTQTKRQLTWIQPDEAALIIGYPPTKSGSHRRRLKKLIDVGLIKKYRKGRPYLYNRKEMEAISERAQKGNLILP